MRMPKYTVQGTIKYLVVENFNRVVEADSEQDAMEWAIDEAAPMAEWTWYDDTLTAAIVEEMEQPEDAKLRAMGMPSLFD